MFFLMRVVLRGSSQLEVGREPTCPRWYLVTDNSNACLACCFHKILFGSATSNGIHMFFDDTISDLGESALDTRSNLEELIPKVRPCT